MESAPDPDFFTGFQAWTQLPTRLARQTTCIWARGGQAPSRAQVLMRPLDATSASSWLYGEVAARREVSSEAGPMGLSAGTSCDLTNTYSSSCHVDWSTIVVTSVRFRPQKIGIYVVLPDKTGTESCRKLIRAHLTTDSSGLEQLMRLLR